MVGCDHKLKSKKVKDRCGVCDGNGDSCSLVTSSYTEDYTTCKPIYIITHILNGLLYYIFLLEYSTRLIEIVCPQSQKRLSSKPAHNSSFRLFYSLLFVFFFQITILLTPLLFYLRILPMLFSNKGMYISIISLVRSSWTPSVLERIVVKF